MPFFHLTPRNAVLVGAAAALTGCASGPPLQLYSGTVTATSVPAIGATATAEVGQTIISKVNVQKVPAIKMPVDVTENINLTGRTTVKAGLIPLWASNTEGNYYRDYNATYSTLGQVVPATTAGVFVPADKTKQTVIYHAPQAGNYGKTPVTGIEHTTVERWVKDSFKRELVYTGVSQNTISVLYREFSDNVARPAFSQELKYDLSQGPIIGYKGARFEVLKATNMELVYKVVKPLD